MKIFITGLCLFFSSLFMYSQNGNSSLNQKVLINPGKYKLIQIIEKLEEIKGVNITYDANSLPLEEIIEINEATTTVKQILDKIQKYFPVEYQSKGEYIILKKKANIKNKITGKIIDSNKGEPLAGASIYIKETHYGVTSEPDGSYSMSLYPGNYILVYSYIGYETEEQSVKAQRRY